MYDIILLYFTHLDYMICIGGVYAFEKLDETYSKIRTGMDLIFCIVTTLGHVFLWPVLLLIFMIRLIRIELVTAAHKGRKG